MNAGSGALINGRERSLGVCHPSYVPGTNHGQERILEGGWQTEVTEAEGVVFRSPGPQSPAVIALLGHLETVGFSAAPRVVGTGFAADGRETLRFVEGRSPQPAAWSDDAAWTLGRTVRAMHEATASFVPPADACWAPWFARNLPGDGPVIGHGDLGPWNILARDGLPVAFIDWDNAGPVDAVWELAQVGWLNAQLHDDDVAAMNDLADPTTRAHQLALIVDGYGLERTRRDGFVHRMIEIAVRSARQEAIDFQVTPESSSPGVGEFPILWAIAWRTRAAAWMLDHQRVLQHALET